MPAFNAEFAQPAPEEGSALVAWIGGRLDDILCEQYERAVGADICVRFEKLILQIPADRHRCHYVKPMRIVRTMPYAGARMLSRMLKREGKPAGRTCDNTDAAHGCCYYLALASFDFSSSNE